MTAAHQNPPTEKRINVTPPQMVALAVLDTVGGTLVQASVLLGDTFKQTEAADILVGLMNALQAQKTAMIDRWQGAVILAKPGDVPNAIGSKVIGL